mgnify:CR=1 FL=1
MKDYKLVAGQREFRVRVTVIVGEFHLEGVRSKKFNNRPYFTLPEASLRDVLC